MNRRVIDCWILLLVLPLLLACGREQQSSLPSLKRQAIHWAERHMEHLQLSTCMDSAYWMGICWNLYQLSQDTAFWIEAEMYMEPLSPLNDSGFNSKTAYRSYLAFGKGFDATGNRHYKHEVWDLGSYLLADTVCINASTIEALLWATAHEGCHCFREAAERWGRRQIRSDSLSIDIIQGLGILYAYTADTVYGEALQQIKQKNTLDNNLDSLRFASVCCYVEPFLSGNRCSDEISTMLQGCTLDEFTTLPTVFYFTEILLNLLE